MNSGKFDNQALAPRTDSVQVGQVLADPIENAIDQWAEASTRAETGDREERLRDKKHIVRSFLKYVGKHLGEVEPADVRAWRKHLESVKSENTVYSYLSFAKTTYVIDFVDFLAGSQETPRHEEFPAFPDGFLHFQLQRTTRPGA